MGKYVYECYHYRYLDGEKVSSIVVTTRSAKEVEENFNGRLMSIDLLGEVEHHMYEDEIRDRFNISSSIKFLH
jgi:hypothetical protein